MDSTVKMTQRGDGGLRLLIHLLCNSGLACLSLLAHYQRDRLENPPNNELVGSSSSSGIS